MTDPVPDPLAADGTLRTEPAAPEATAAEAPVEAVALLQCTSVALAKAKELSGFLDTKLAEDAKRRDKGGLLAELSAENDR